MPDYRFFHQNGSVSWRELTGADEQSVAATDTRSAITLLARLLVDRTGDEPWNEARVVQLPVAERDRLLAHVYLREFGDSVAASPTCTACHDTFDLTFSVSSLLESMNREHESAHSQWVEMVEPGQPAVFQLKSGDRVRLVTGADERALATLDGETAKSSLLHNCVLTRASHASDEELLTLLAQLAPVMDHTIDTRCAECGEAQHIAFSMQRYTLTSLRQRHAHLLRDIHLLAYAYKWPMAEILDLSRSQRLALSNMVLEGHS